MTENVVVRSGATVPISSELLQDAPDVLGMVRELMVYGQPRTHANPMPTFVLVPWLQRAEDWIRRTRGRFSDAISAFRYGIPEDNCEDW